MRTDRGGTTDRREHPRRDRVQSVQRALAILETYGHDASELGVTEIARRVGLTKSVVFRVVQTLAEAGFLERADQDGTYQIGRRAWEVGSLYRGVAGLKRAALDPMRRLAAQQGHNVYLGVLDGRDVIYIHVVEGAGPIKVHATIGSRLHTHASAMGKVFLAWLGHQEAHRLLTQEPLEPLTPSTITDAVLLDRQLVQVRRRGYAINRGEAIVGVGSIAAPVRDRSGAVVAAVSNGFPLMAVSRTDWKRMTAEVVRCADEISERLGAADV